MRSVITTTTCFLLTLTPTAAMADHAEADCLTRLITQETILSETLHDIVEDPTFRTEAPFEYVDLLDTWRGASVVRLSEWQHLPGAEALEADPIATSIPLPPISEMATDEVMRYAIGEHLRTLERYLTDIAEVQDRQVRQAMAWRIADLALQQGNGLALLGWEPLERVQTLIQGE